jgi:hypothetical protein
MQISACHVNDRVKKGTTTQHLSKLITITINKLHPCRPFVNLSVTVLSCQSHCAGPTPRSILYPKTCQCVPYYYNTVSYRTVTVTVSVLYGSPGFIQGCAKKTWCVATQHFLSRTGGLVWLGTKLKRKSGGKFLVSTRWGCLFVCLLVCLFVRGARPPAGSCRDGPEACWSPNRRQGGRRGDSEGYVA